MSAATDNLDTIALLQAMYPLTEELVLSPDTAALVECSNRAVPLSLEATLSVRLDGHEDRVLEISIGLSNADGQAKISPRHPAWLSRSAHQTLASSVSEHESDALASEYILTTIDQLKTTATELYAASLVQESATDDAAPVEEEDSSMERVWFWFPMLSTREKRKNLVEYAPRYNLTGFVIAGKPALLCLEGNGRAVERYMSDIKSNSWGDIPSFQKKVTERFRRTITREEKKFDSMTDITNTITHHGQYNHRGDMGQVRLLMEKWGVGEDFGAAVMNNMT